SGGERGGRPLAPPPADGGAGGGERRGRSRARRLRHGRRRGRLGRRLGRARPAAGAPAHGGGALLLRGDEQRRGGGGAGRAGGRARGAARAGAAQAAGVAGAADEEERMTPERFETLIAAYGADPRRWPEAEREAALAFAEGDPRAQTALAAERRLDALLDRAEAPRAAPELVARFAATPRRERLSIAGQAAALAAAIV